MALHVFGLKKSPVNIRARKPIFRTIAAAQVSQVTDKNFYHHYMIYISVPIYLIRTIKYIELNKV